MFVFFRGNVSHVSPSGGRSDSSSASSRKGGRISAPQLRLLGGVQRTHHDLTTPATGKKNISIFFKKPLLIKEHKSRYFLEI